MDIRFDESRQIFVVDANDFDYAAGMGAFDPLVDELASHPGAGILIFRDKVASSPISWEQIRVMLHSDQAAALAPFAGRRVATVVEGLVRIGVGRQISAVVSEADIEYQSFTSEAEAVAWLTAD